MTLALLYGITLCVLFIDTFRARRDANHARDEALTLIQGVLEQEERLLDALAWMAHGQADDVAGEFAVIEDYCRRVLAGEQHTSPATALRHIQTTATEALRRTTVATPTPRGEGT